MSDQLSTLPTDATASEGGLWPPGKWHPGIEPVRCGSGTRLWGTGCPECGGAAAACNPRGWTVANRPFPAWAAGGDGEPLCPVMTSTGYRPASMPTWSSESASLRAVEGGEPA